MSNDMDNRGALFAVSSGDQLIRTGEWTIKGEKVPVSLIQKELPSGKVIFSVQCEIGVVFANHDKKSEKSPDMSGSVTHAGKEFDVAGWKQISKAGLAYTSVKLTPRPEPEEEEEEEKPSASAGGTGENPNTPQAMGSDADPTKPIPPELDDDEIPF